MTAKANAKTAPAAKKSAANEIVITRVFNAPRALVYRAWTNPVHLARWWGPRGFTNPHCEIDVRAGGTIRIDMRAPNGTIYPMAGIFLELKEPEQIVYTSGALDEKGVQIFEFLHTVDFSEKNGKTTLVMRSRVVKTTPDAAKYIGGFEAGMGQSLDKLADDLVHQGEPLVLERTFNAPMDRVWQAITTKEDFQHWYFELAEFKPATGFEFQFAVEHEGNKYEHICRVTEVVPGKKIAHTWRYAGQPGDSLVTWELFPDGNQTRLKLTHEGLATFPKAKGYARSNFNQGWTSLIGTSLKEYLEKAPDEIAARSIIISRIVDAPRELVWEAMANPKHVVHWWGPRGFSTTTELHEFRVGGQWKHVMQGPDGAKYPNYSVFQEIVKPERIVYQHSGKREDGPAISKLFTWTFDVVDGGKTKVTINMLFPNATERDFVVKEFGALEGGKQTLERLDEFLAKNKNKSSTKTTSKNMTTAKNTGTIQPYLNFDGNCDEALEFYKQAIGINVTMLMRYKDSPDKSMMTPGSENKVMHASFTFGDSTVMASDGRCTGKPGFHGFHLSLSVSDPALAQKHFTALSQGGQVHMPLTKTFFSAAFGMIIDRFGVMWMIYVPGQP